MVWYYRDNDQEIGPVSKAELQNLVKSKQIGAQTPVRNVEMTDWVPLIDVVRGKAGQTQSPPPLNMASSDDGIGELTMDAKDVTGPGEAGDEAPAVSGGEEAHLAICSQCGGTFPEDQVIAIEDRMICAACKPMFVQKLKEGVSMPLSTAFGGFWIRFLAYIIDYFIFGIVSWIILMPIGMFVMPNLMRAGNPPDPGSIFALLGLYMLVILGIPLFYFTFFHGRWGATVGKMACGLRVVTAEGEPITYMRAFGRFWGFMLSGLILDIGFIMAAFDDEKRSLHDRICSTRVIKKR